MKCYPPRAKGMRRRMPLLKNRTSLDMWHILYRSFWKSSTVRDQGDSEALDLRQSVILRYVDHHGPFRFLEAFEALLPASFINTLDRSWIVSSSVAVASDSTARRQHHRGEPSRAQQIFYTLHPCTKRCTWRACCRCPKNLVADLGEPEVRSPVSVTIPGMSRPFSSRALIWIKCPPVSFCVTTGLTSSCLDSNPQQQSEQTIRISFSKIWKGTTEACAGAS